MFAEWELIGVPHRVVVSDRGIKDGSYEVLHRREAEPKKIAIDQAASTLRSLIKC